MSDFNTLSAGSYFPHRSASTAIRNRGWPECLITIALPRDYELSPARYPALYVLDACPQFGLLVQTYRLLRHSNLIPPPVLVGIACEGAVSRFLQCFGDEFIPFVEAEYRVNPADRTLVGDSFGGLFGSYVLFNTPNLFNRHLIVSPTAWWNDWQLSRMRSATPPAVGICLPEYASR